MLSSFLVFTLLVSSASAGSIPLPRRSEGERSVNVGGSPVYIACVSDSKIPSLTQAQAVNATSREECSTTCASSASASGSTPNDLAFYRQDTSECYCTSSADAPTPDELVYAVDQDGNCRSSDDASVEYLHSSYSISTCLLPPLSTPSSNFTSTKPVDCFTGCPNSTQSIAVRPEYNDQTDTFEYECGCYDSAEEVTGGQKLDCGFGIETIYVKA
ncbi:uncharacterized protein I303_101074 [Kwoniella dejecticola CBS 10117]|uniref:WSC domain-containing protein n=1 Tax=Kwoniella dejecticola CBS 10117 TaxID=1296121 RepID=A0A1A6AGR2_9TREE|nr:uncharacterized protein I303_01077 [Kwoniella dejecticola CBS 10117]OBR89252.1 hypothetical protein I303_01077 [Kwoniella dejecticola CBS 10117]